MTQHLNFCRQMVKQFTSMASVPSVQPPVRQHMSHCIDLAKASQKFILPDGGRLYDDPEYRALDDSERLTLPFPLIAIEFMRSAEYVENHKYRNDSPSSIQTNKGLLFARERDEIIVITLVAWYAPTGMWAPYPEVVIPRVNYLDRGNKSESGHVGIRVITDPRNAHVPTTDYMDEIGALLCMLNVLQCKNIKIERSSGGSVRKAMGRKGALPFDDYHILTVDTVAGAPDGGGLGGSGRSPREHLRRGHIRRLVDRKIWVNATVVNPGIGGKVTKDYRIAATAAHAG